MPDFSEKLQLSALNLEVRALNDKPLTLRYRPRA
jgi:hypothetical protein